MSFNNGNERRKLNAKWEQLRVQYREAGMSEEAIQAMYEFDLGVLNSERAYDASTVAVCDGEDDVDARKAADLKQYEAAITVTDTYHETKSRFGWIGEIENERLLAALESLSELDLKILTLYVYAGYTESEIASALESKRITIHKRIERMTEINTMITELVKNTEMKKGANALMKSKIIGVCPNCGKPVVEREKGWFCENRECRFVLWKDNAFFKRLGKRLDAHVADKLLRDGRVRLKDCKSAKGKTYNATVLLSCEADGRSKFSLEFEGGC